MMTEESNNHPSQQDLTAFSSGRLEEECAVEVSHHVETCLSCQEALNALDTDELSSLLRQSRNEEVPSERAMGSSIAVVAGKLSTVHQEEGAGIALDAPPELLAHPRYHLIEKLGEGGMGAVYRAHDRRMGRMVAIKIIRPSLIHEPETIQRFQREVRAAAALNHPNIVTVYDADEVENLHFLVMEVVEGQDLLNRVRTNGPLPIDEACESIRQTALGLLHACDRGLTHRDIKPRNLMRTEGGQIKILDFGLACLATGSRPSEPREVIGQGLGTVDFIAPEQIRDAGSVDVRADIYSLGCTLFFLLTGKPPFTEGDPKQVVAAHLEREPPDLNAVRPDVPQSLAQLVARMLRKSPGERPATPEDVARAVEPFIKKTTNNRRIGRGWWMVASCLLAGIIAVVLMWSPNAGQHEPTSQRTVEASPPETVPDQKPIDEAPKEVLRITEHAGPVLAVTFGRNEEELVSASADGTVRWWDRTTGKEIRKVQLPTGGRKIKGMAISADWKRCLCFDDNGDVLLVSISTGEEQARYRSGAPIRVVALSPVNDEVLYAGEDQKEFAWVDLRTSQVRGRFSGHEGLVSSLDFSPDGRQAFSGSARGVIRAWDLTEKRESGRFLGHHAFVTFLALTPDGKQLLSGGMRNKGSKDRSVRVWDVQSRQQLHCLQGHTKMVRQVVLSSNGHLALSGADDKTARVWDLASDKELYTLDGYGEGVPAVAFSRDGRLVLTGGADRTIRVWQLPR